MAGGRACIGSLRKKLTFSNAIALIALFVSLGGTVYAAATINGKSIRRNSIPADRLKKDSVGGAQVKEAALGTVPSAARAEQAAHAASAGTAGVAARADRAGKADLATEVPKADLAATTEHAKAADTAARAQNAVSLAGVGGDRYLRRCDAGAVKAVVSVEIVGTGPRVVGGFNCADEPGAALGATVARVPNRPAEYDLEVRGLLGSALANSTATASGVGINSAASVSRVGAVFRVKVFSVGSEEPAPNEPFTVAIF